MYVCDIDRDCKAATHHGHVHGLTQYKMASNIQLTTGRDREIAGFNIVVSLKTKFKRHILEEFHGYSWAFCPGHCSR